MRIVSLGNAGIFLQNAAVSIAVDPYFPERTGEPDVASQIFAETAVNGFLVSHHHWDHFDPEKICFYALKYSSWIAGPKPIVNILHAMAPNLNLIPLEPPWAGTGQPAAFQTVEPAPECRITAFRTPHGRVHVSFLVETAGVRLYFDCDNHDDRILPLHMLKPLDAVFLYPWKRSGWREFLKAAAPSVWFLIHLSLGEMEDYAKGLPPCCMRCGSPVDHVSLKAGEAWDGDFSELKQYSKKCP